MCENFCLFFLFSFHRFLAVFFLSAYFSSLFPCYRHQPDKLYQRFFRLKMNLVWTPKVLIEGAEHQYGQTSLWNLRLPLGLLGLTTKNLLILRKKWSSFSVERYWEAFWNTSVGLNGWGTGNHCGKTIIRNDSLRMRRLKTGLLSVCFKFFGRVSADFLEKRPKMWNWPKQRSRYVRIDIKLNCLTWS